jgi:hypothetical protein
VEEYYLVSLERSLHLELRHKLRENFTSIYYPKDQINIGIAASELQTNKMQPKVKSENILYGHKFKLPLNGWTGSDHGANFSAQLGDVAL